MLFLQCHIGPVGKLTNNEVMVFLTNLSEALDKCLNEGRIWDREGSDLKLDLVYNPSGAFLPGDQNGLRKRF